MHCRLIFAAGLLLAAVSPVAAQSSLQHIDVALYNDGGKIGTGFFDFGPPATFVTDVGQFSEPLEQISPDGFSGVGAPGFITNPSQQPLAGGTFVFFDIPAIDHPFLSPYANASYTVDVHNLLYWDGVDDDNNGDLLDDVAFSSPPAGHSMQVFENDSANATADGSSSPVTGFRIGIVNNSGVLHEHVGFRAFRPGGTQPEDALFILPMTFSGFDGDEKTNKVIDDSETVYLVFNGVYQRDTNGDILKNGFLALTDPAAADAADQWVEAYLIRDPGDFNDSDALDADDIDQLFAQEGLADPAFGFDLTGDAIVTDADLDRWVYDLAGTRYGDANLDGSVDILDLGLLATSFGGAGGWGNGDFNGDGQINIVDLGILATEFGFSAAVTSEVFAALGAGDLDAAQAIYAANVPEPATAALLALGAAATIARRRSAMAG